MTSKEILDSYNKADYVGPPTSIVGDEMVYKYREPIHFVEFLTEVNAKNLRKSHQRSSIDGSSWSGARSLPEAFEKFRTAEFDKSEAKKLSNLVIQMRQGVKFTDTGDDISIPEFLGGSRDHWIEFQDRDRKKQPVMKSPIFINLSASAGENESEMSRAAYQIVRKLYERQIKCPKIVVCYFSNMYMVGNLQIYIEMPYFDFNSLKRFSFCSTFRRMAFVNYEMVRALPGGYGMPFPLPMAETLYDVISIDRFTHMSNSQIEKQMDQIINNTFKK